MRHIEFDPHSLPEPLKGEWMEWNGRAEAATVSVIEAWEEWRSKGSPDEFKPELNEKLWGELKIWLYKNIFHNKCAYCETKDVRSVYHAEHFRPKGRVRFRVPNKKTLQKGMTINDEGKQVEHPGYFWLAYHWANLLPSCNDCNTALGKKDQFPAQQHISVKKLKPDEVTKLKKRPRKSTRMEDLYYLEPEDLNVLEKPSLLHPYFDDPSHHLVFGDCGIVAARDDSPIGLASIQVYNLDGGTLQSARHFEQEFANKTYNDEFSRGLRKTLSQRLTEAKSVIKAYSDGTERYSAAVMDYLRLAHPQDKL